MILKQFTSAALPLQLRLSKRTPYGSASSLVCNRPSLHCRAEREKRDFELPTNLTSPGLGGSEVRGSCSSHLHLWKPLRCFACVLVQVPEASRPPSTSDSPSTSNPGAYSIPSPPSRVSYPVVAALAGVGTLETAYLAWVWGLI
jgi:hypothetical protein